MTVYGRRVWIAVVGAAIAVGGMPSLVFAEAEKASVAIAAQPTQRGDNALDGVNIVEESMTIRASFGLPATRDDVEKILASRGMGTEDAGRYDVPAEGWGFILTEAEAHRLESREALYRTVEETNPGLFAFDGFAGAYLDVETDQLVIQYSKSVPFLDLSLLEARGVSASQLRFVAVQHSSAYLTNVQVSLWKEAASLSGDPLVSIAEAVEENGLVVTLSDGVAPEAAHALRLELQLADVHYVVRTGTAYDDACTSRTSCNSAQRAGVRVTVGGNCSSGWVVNRSGVRYALTAEHCWFGTNSGTVTSGGGTFGSLNSVNTLAAGSHADLRLIRTTTSQPWIYHSNSTKSRVVNGTSGPVVNGTACLYGANSESGRCGTIASTNASKWSPTCGCTLYGMVTANYSQSVSTGGDSGGAVSSSNTGQWARGVHQGSDGSTKYFTNIAYLSTYGLGSVATG